MRSLAKHASLVLGTILLGSGLACAPAPMREPLLPGAGGLLDQCPAELGATGPLYAAPESLIAGIRTKRSVQRYSIRAQDAETLQRALYNRGALIDGERFGASVEWRVAWQLSWAPVESSASGRTRCAVTDAQIDLEIDYHMPLWADEARADEALRRSWHAMLLFLNAHERGHECAALQAAAEIRDRLASLSMEGSCSSEMSTRAEAVASEVIARWNETNATFDEVSDHGMREGTFFP